MSRPARKKRHAERVQKASEKRIARAVKAVKASGWQYVSHDHYVRLACSEALAARFDASIPQGDTPASWLCEIVETLLSAEESELQALIKRGARAMPRDKADDLEAGGKNIRTRISSFLWAEIEKRATQDNASSATDWLRKLVSWAVQPPMNWRKQEQPSTCRRGSRTQESTGAEGGQPNCGLGEEMGPVVEEGPKGGDGPA